MWQKKMVQFVHQGIDKAWLKMVVLWYTWKQELFNELQAQTVLEKTERRFFKIARKNELPFCTKLGPRNILISSETDIAWSHLIAGSQIYRWYSFWKAATFGYTAIHRLWLCTWSQSLLKESNLQLPMSDCTASNNSTPCLKWQVCSCTCVKWEILALE